MPSWGERQAELSRVAARQLFFIGGAPRSGTTWLQQMLDCHPDICCRGEGLFLNQLTVPLERMMAERRRVLDGKNISLFRHTGGYPLPADGDVEFLAGTAVLLALGQQCASSDCLAIGEKTPENVFFFERLHRLFPTAKFIGLARDPRDVLTSAWHFFRKPVAADVEVAEKTAFIRSALPSLANGARAMIAFGERHPASYRLVTYEAMCGRPATILVDLLRFIGVSDREEIVEDCVKRTSFGALNGGRAAGVALDGSFFRKGVAGDWASTLTPAMSAMVLEELGWMYPHFGWQA